MPLRARVIRRVRRTVLIACEGKTDEGFLRHLRKHYCSGRDDAPNVDFKQSYGKGGDHVVNVLIRQLQNKAYDHRVALIDADAPPNGASLKKLAKAKAAKIVLTPCLEGLLLDVLGRPKPDDSPNCKKMVQEIEPRDLSDPSSFGTHWPKAVFESARQRIEVLNALLRLFE